MATTLLDRHHPVVPEIDDDLTRRRLLAGIGVLGLTVTLAGCADDADGTGDAAAPASPDPTPSDGRAGPFPVTIAHKFGETTIPAEPKRIVVAGLVEQDPLLALGIVPVATTEWFGDHPGAIQPWARDALGGAPLPEVRGGGNGSNYQFERIAALRPDLIVALLSPVRPSEEDRPHRCRGGRDRGRASPLVFLATADHQGACTISPKGGPPGFVKVLDDKRLAIPDYVGNELLDGLRT